MNLDALFRDYEARMAAQDYLDIEADAREQYTSEFAKITLADRLAGQLGQELEVVTVDNRRWKGVLESVGYGWIQLGSQAEGVLIQTSAIAWWEGGSRFSSVDSGSVARKLSFTFAIRSLLKYRVAARIFMEGQIEFEGQLDRVGADFLQIKIRPYGEVGVVGKTWERTVPVARIAALALRLSGA